MDNLTALLIILSIWALKGFITNLALLISVYYITYLLIDSLVNYSHLYYSLQIAVDLIVIMSCCLLAYRDIHKSFIYLGYATVVSTSLIVDVSALLDEAFKTYSIQALYEFRQSFSHALDIAFAILGSLQWGFIKCLFVCTALSALYFLYIQLT